MICVLSAGNVASSITFPEIVPSSQYSICTVSRYRPISGTGGGALRIFQGTGVNWLHGACTTYSQSADTLIPKSRKQANDRAVFLVVLRPLFLITHLCSLVGHWNGNAGVGFFGFSFATQTSTSPDVASTSYWLSMCAALLSVCPVDQNVKRMPRNLTVDLI